MILETVKKAAERVSAKVIESKWGELDFVSSQGLKVFLCHYTTQERLLIAHLDGSVHTMYLFQTQVVNRNYWNWFGYEIKSIIQGFRITQYMKVLPYKFILIFTSHCLYYIYVFPQEYGY